jgi:signal transduction histidine kinase
MQLKLGLKSFRQFWRPQRDEPSLQLRLTAGMTTIALLSVGTIGTWTTWQMRNMLVVKHQEKLSRVATQLDQQLSAAPVSQWPTTVETWASPELWVGFKPVKGELIQTAPDQKLAPVQDKLTDLANWQAMPTAPTVQTLNGHHLVLARQPIKQARPQDISQHVYLGELYLARDITHDYTVLSTLVNTLRFGTLIALIPIVSLIAMYIRRALQPLRQVNQLAQSGQMPETMPSESLPIELRGLVQELSALSNRLSDELRTSLCLIQGYLNSTLRRGDNLTPVQRESLQVAASEADRMVLLLQDLLDLGRMYGTVQCCLQPVLLNDLVKVAIQLADPEQERLIEVKAEQPVIAQGEADQLQRVLSQLLKNAKQFSKSDQPIQIQLQQTTDWAMIQISDRGCGISEADQRRIFEPFYRVESSRCRATGGMGLGLAIALPLIKAMGGEISVESQLGLGSTFTIKLLPAKLPAALPSPLLPRKPFSTT